ncbi:hypothetical protein HDV06_002721 [Boothiomyces sp. JEL0866]|nr:hypothetical protein HDV06_002721 [Boothiomyces sp. JEL0866]
MKHQIWLPFETLFVKLDCKDEAKIAREMRKIKELTVSEDGRAVTMDLPSWDIDSNTLYVAVDGQVDLQSFNLYGKVLQTWIDSSNKFAFVTFADNVDQIVQEFPKHLQEKIMAKQEWNKRTEEYYLLSTRNIERASIRFTVNYQKGVVGYFENIHCETNSKVLRQLFELAAPVAFVEYTKGDSTGYVRFKDPISADYARNLFSRVTIRQSNKECRGKIFPFTRFSSGIKLTILFGKEEEEYWDWLNHNAEENETVTNTEPIKETKVLKKDKPPKKKAVHLKFDEPEEPRKPRKRKVESDESDAKKAKVE